MATPNIHSTNDGNFNLSVDWNKINILTLDGYSKVFEKCENGSQVLYCQKLLYDEYDPNRWMERLKLERVFDSIKPLVELPGKLFPNAAHLRRESVITLIQFYSLLENVFRNVLLRPYVPAYRTINQDSCVYSCFIRPYQDRLPFDEFTFKYTKPNLLTYTETDPSKTILYALTCSILCQYFIMKRRNIDGN